MTRMLSTHICTGLRTISRNEMEQVFGRLLRDAAAAANANALSMSRPYVRTVEPRYSG